MYRRHNGADVFEPFPDAVNIVRKDKWGREGAYPNDFSLSLSLFWPPPLFSLFSLSLLLHRGRALFPLGQDKKFRPRGTVTEKKPPKHLNMFFSTQAQVCDSLPSIDEMKQYTDEGALKAYLDGISHILSVQCYKTYILHRAEPLVLSPPSLDFDEQPCPLGTFAEEQGKKQPSHFI